jgi:hypothetical protein
MRRERRQPTPRAGAHHLPPSGATLGARAKTKYRKEQRERGRCAASGARRDRAI